MIVGLKARQIPTIDAKAIATEGARMGLLEGKVAIITGGGKGIGFGIASAFAEEGANLCITGRNEQRLVDAEAKLKEQYGLELR